MFTACSEARAAGADEVATAASRRLPWRRLRGVGVARVRDKPSRADGRAPALDTPPPDPPS